ncbi:MAG: rhomboid family intramembrane serine protease [Defluviitaleaceae bacterium]|nr:rhomboid family intramembrane serine protease [Defluviitaleaceae bacterium]
MIPLYENFTNNFHYELTQAGYIRLNIPADFPFGQNTAIWAREAGAVAYFYIIYDTNIVDKHNFDSIKNYMDEAVKSVKERIGARHSVIFNIFIGGLDEFFSHKINTTQEFILMERYDLFAGVSKNLHVQYKSKSDINTDKCLNKIENALRKMTDGIIMPMVSQNRPSHIAKSIIKFPYFSATIIAINILMFALMELSGGSQNTLNLLRFGAANYYLTFEHMQLYRLVTPIFLHIGFVHLLFNTMWIAIVGIRAEKYMGHFKFLILYLASGIVGGIAMMLLSPNAVGAGASGAIFGMFGALLAFTLVTKKQAGDLSASTLGMLIVLQVLFGFAAPGILGEGINIANSAHIGGLIVGFVLGFIFTKIPNKKKTNNAK